jgi:hypothetical protein
METDRHSFGQGLYEEMTERIDSAVMSGEISQEIKVKHKGFSEWDAGITANDHQPIVQVDHLFIHCRVRLISTKGSEIY